MGVPLFVPMDARAARLMRGAGWPTAFLLQVGMGAGGGLLQTS